MSHLVVKDLKKSFGKASVLKGVSFEVQDGESIALIGANGSGKSTLLRSVVRLIEPNSGTIEILGRDITRLSRRELRAERSSIGFVFQKHQIVPRLSALSNVIHGALGKHSSPLFWYQNLAPTWAREQALHCLKQVGLAEFAAKRVDQLSGGQAQRVAVARALMQKPKLLLADEPTASLDPASGVEIMELMRSLTTKEGITLVFTCHDMELACKYSDRIIGLKDGVVSRDSKSKSESVSQLKEFFDAATNEKTVLNL